MPSQYAASALNKAGHDTITSPYLYHDILTFFTKLIPRNLLISKTFSQNKHTLQRAIAKRTKEAKRA